MQAMAAMLHDLPAESIAKSLAEPRRAPRYIGRRAPRPERQVMPKYLVNCGPSPLSSRAAARLHPPRQERECFLFIFWLRGLALVAAPIEIL